jgi:transcriptional regulator with XRE-family HTH domain
VDNIYFRSPDDYVKKFVGPVALGYRLRCARLRLGYTQEQVSWLLNVTRGQVSNWERGVRTIDAFMYARLCAVLELDMQDALEREGYEQAVASGKPPQAA